MSRHKSESRVAFRTTAAMRADLEAIAARDHNGVGPTARRLLSQAIAREREKTERGA